MRSTSSLKILEHVDAITRHRDSALLDRSIVSSLLELLKVKNVRLHEIVRRRGVLLAAVTAWNEGGAVHFLPDLPTDDDLQPVESIPALAASLERQQPIFQEAISGCHYWLPVFLRDVPVACFEIMSPAPLPSHQVDMADGMLALYRNYLSLLEDSQQDTLTGLANRKTFEYSLARLLTSINTSHARGSRAERRAADSRDHWLAVVDIDHFKRINDQFGHLFGDEVLILIANIMRNTFRQQDRLFRFGGEEFVVLVRNVTLEGARRSAERFRQAVESHPFPPQVGRITVSVGFARIHPEDTPSTVLGQADEALYHAKENGRNQVQCHEELIASGVFRKREYPSHVEMF